MITTFNKRTIDVVDILHSAAVVGKYRGIEVYGKLEQQMNEISNDTLTLIDIRKANPLQYEFCQYAFGPLFAPVNYERWKQKSIIFQMHAYHESGFFRGILKYLGTQLPRKDSEIGFISSGYYCKLILGDEPSIAFVGYLSDNQKKVLEEVNRKKVNTAKDIVSTLELSVESVAESIRFLVDKSFLMTPGGEKEHVQCYYSFYNYL
jgi:hypothetical protein